LRYRVPYTQANKSAFSILSSMNRTKIFAFITVSALLFACGSQDEPSAAGGGPPVLKNGGRVGPISPFDTLKAEFDSRIIDIDKLDSTNIEVFQAMSLVFPEGNTTSNTLHFIGTNKAEGSGLEHFEQDIRNDSIVLLNLKNEIGYVQTRAVFYYSTYPILDSPNNEEATPDSLEKNFGQKNLERGITFAGVIGLNEQPVWVDLNDFFTLSLEKYDSLIVTLRNTRNPDVKLELKFPLINTNDSTIVAETNSDKTKSIHYKMDPEFMPEEAHSKPIVFKIKVSLSSSNSTLTPYLLDVRIRKRELLI